MKLYAWFWLHTQFWIKDKKARRPYTFLIRDFYHEHPILFIFLEAWLIYLINHLLHTDWKIWVGITIGVLLGHLFWGKQWQQGEQEEPGFSGEDPICECGIQMVAREKKIDDAYCWYWLCPGCGRLQDFAKKKK